MPAAYDPTASSGGVALIAAQSVVRKLEVIALADQDAERPLTVTGLRGWRREAPAQHRDRGIELGHRVLRCQCRGDHLRCDAKRQQLALDAIRAPGVQRAAVLRE